MSDNLNQLADVLYGRAAMPDDYIGGSDARIFHDAAGKIAFLQSIASRDDNEREIQLQREAQLTQKHQAFRATVAAALAELQAEFEQKHYLSQDSALDMLRDTIYSLKLTSEVNEAIVKARKEITERK